GPVRAASAHSGQGCAPHAHELERGGRSGRDAHPPSVAGNPAVGKRAVWALLRRALGVPLGGVGICLVLPHRVTEGTGTVRESAGPGAHATGCLSAELLRCISTVDAGLDDLVAHLAHRGPPPLRFGGVMTVLDLESSLELEDPADDEVAR